MSQDIKKTVPEGQSSTVNQTILQQGGNVQPTIYRVRDWANIYENNRSRTVNELRWVLVPNKHDSDGYCFVMSHERADSIYAAWILTLQIASRCTPRGTLVLADGSPHTPETLAMRTRAKREWFELALPFLASRRIGWLEIVDPTSQAIVSHTAPRRQPPVRPVPLDWQPRGSDVTIEGKGMEENGKGKINKNAPLSIAEKISLERELERIVTELADMGRRSDYGDGSQKQKRFDALTTRQKELRQTLRVVA